MFSKSSIAAVLAGASLAVAQINPLTVTSLSPDQSSALLSAIGPFATSLENDPALTSVALDLATDSAALSSFTAIAASISNIPTGSAAVAQVESLIAALPSPAASFYSSVLVAEIALASSVLNSGQAGQTSTAGGSGSSTGSGSTMTTSTGSSSGSKTASAQSTNAAATGGAVKAAGVAVGFFAGAVAML